MPPALWLQGRPDEVHDYHDADFELLPATSPSGSSAIYRGAGGDIEIAYFDNAKAKHRCDATNRCSISWAKHCG